jgi:sphingolipid delta-4 desaturase
MTAVETAMPHLRVSAKTSKTEPASTRIQAPEALVDDHFFWTYTEEPHRSRRQAIIKAHPEVSDLVS